MNISDKKQIVYKKNYRYLVTIHLNLIRTISNRLGQNKYHCYLIGALTTRGKLDRASPLFQ